MSWGILTKQSRCARTWFKKEGIQSFIFCPGFTHQALAKIADAVGEKVAINVARGDVPSTMLVSEILTKEGWFS